MAAKEYICQLCGQPIRSVTAYRRKYCVPCEIDPYRREIFLAGKAQKEKYERECAENVKQLEVKN
jgi:hypothetical protein